jgi:dsDNA-specific endonuclease/ATPase MutS2
LNEIWQRTASRPLLLVDEFARTTTPLEGKALLVALLRAIRRRGWLAFAATHLGGIARQAGVRHFVVRGLRGIPKAARGGDLQTALAALAESMDYAVVEMLGDGTGQADALALATLIGLDEEVVAEAAALLHDESETAWTR